MYFSSSLDILPAHQYPYNMPLALFEHLVQVFEFYLLPFVVTDSRLLAAFSREEGCVFEVEFTSGPFSKGTTVLTFLLFITELLVADV